MVRDPLRRLHRRGEIDEIQYRAANRFSTLWEDATSGLRGINYGEHVDGGKMPDVSERMLYVTRAVADFREEMGPDRIRLMELLCVEGLTIQRIADTGLYGRDTRTVMKQVKAALNKAALLLIGGAGEERAD